MKNKIEMGLMLTFSGLNKLMGFMPMPEMAEAGTAFMSALAETKYIMPAIALVEIVGGILLAINKSVPFALILLAPIVFNIFCFHLILDPAGLGAGITFVVTLGWFAWNRKEEFSSLFK